MAHNRKQLMEEILGNFHAMKNKMHGKLTAGHKGPLTYSQQLALFLISQNKNIGIKEISKTLGISSSATTQLVNELVKQGYVVRNINPKDHRELDLVVSRKGQTQVSANKKKQMKAISALFAKLTDKELLMVIHLHKKILSTIK